MPKPSLPLVLLAVLSFAQCASPPVHEGHRCSLRVARVRVEHRVDPVGVDAERPVLDWALAPDDDDRRGAAQTAYRVLVASDPELLARGVGDLWDSGFVASSETLGIRYAGRPLRSHERAHLAVQVWDEQARPSAWSAPATFVTGLRAPESWRAAWIGFDAPRDEAARAVGDLGGARWIWTSAEALRDASLGPQAFRASVAVPAGFPVARAELLLSVDDAWELFVDGVSVAADDTLDAWRRPTRVDLGEALGAGGTHVLAIAARNRAPGPAGLVARLVVSDADGRERVFESGPSWRAQAAPTTADWTLAGFDDSSWPAAVDLGPVGVAPWGPLASRELLLPPPRLLRGEFAVARPVARATLFASALGVYEVELDGAKVGDEFLSPGWTDASKRIHARAYDVTSALATPGAHALGVTLADGWYAGYVGYGGRRELQGASTRASLELHVEYADGGEDVFATGPDWRASTGPIVSSDLLQGEVHDARRELDGWSRAGFDDSGWRPVDVSPAPAVVPTLHPGEPIRVVEEVVPRSVTKVGDDAWVFDLGTNIAGVARLAVRGEAGRTLTLRHAERVLDDGSLYTTNLRGARAVDTYVCKGTGLETWQPRFTFHGFQHVELSGLGYEPSLDAVTGLVLSSDLRPAGTFACSDPMLDTLFANTVRTWRSNSLDVPTDCPQRDERLGWTGDAQTFVRTATWICDAEAFFDKWLLDLVDAQRADGQFPMVAPLFVAGDDGGPAWADAGTIVPDAIFDAYGDRELLARDYAAMKRYVDFSVARTVDLLPPTDFHCFGDWVALGADTPREVIYEAYLARSAQLVADAAAVLGRADDAAHYGELAADVRAAFRRAYVDDDARVLGDTQCAYVLALAFDLLEPGQRARAAEHLVARIAERDWHLSTGFVGTKDLLFALSAIGRDDVGYRLLQNRSYPSWGFTIAHGATSIWERWDGWTPEKGFQDPGMNSFAHYAFGAVTQWMFERVGGLRPLAPGFAEVEIAPVVGGDLTWAATSHDSVRGELASRWTLRDGGRRLELEVVVPPNVRARVRVPTRAPDSITEGGRPVADVAHLSRLAVDDDGVVFEASSGTYRFACDAPVVRRLDADAH